MSGPALGYVAAIAQYGLDSILVRPRRSVGPLTLQVVVEEVHHDDLEIVTHPVEHGALIADHAFKRPEEVVIRGGWSDSPTFNNLLAAGSYAAGATVAGVQSMVTGNSATQMRDAYQKLLELQVKREPMDVYTGKRFYKEMLVKSITATTDKDFENSLFVTLTLQQVLRVRTQLVTLAADAIKQANPGSTNPPSNQGLKVPTPSSRFKFDLLGGGQ